MSAPPYTLFYSPGTAATVIHWVLIELGVDFATHLVDFDSRSQKDEAYLALNPRGIVPTLVVDGLPYSESAALLLLLSERHPDANLAPVASDPLRAKFLETLMYITCNLLPAMRDWHYLGKDTPIESASVFAAHAEARIEAVWTYLEAQLEGKKYLMGGESPTVVDYMAVNCGRWSRNMPKTVWEWSNMKGLIKRMTERESWKGVSEREGISGWPPVEA